MNPQDICSIAFVHLYGDDGSRWEYWDNPERAARAVKSLKLIYEACNSDPEAQFKLVRCVSSGIDLKSDVNMAGKFYRLALKNGYTLSPPANKSGLTPEQEANYISKIRRFVLQHSCPDFRYEGCKAVYSTFRDANPLHFDFCPPCRKQDTPLSYTSGDMVITEDGSLFIEHNDWGMFYLIEECEADTLINASKAIDEYNLLNGVPEQEIDLSELYVSETEMDDMLTEFESYLSSILDRWRDVGIDMRIDENYRDPLIEKIRGAIRPVDSRQIYYHSQLDTDEVKPHNIERLKTFADEGDPEACYYLFQIYCSYQMYVYDDGIVLGYIKRAAEAGYEPAIAPYINVGFMDDDRLMPHWIYWHKGGGYASVDINQCGSHKGIVQMREMLDFCKHVSKSFPQCLDSCVEKLKEYAAKHVFESFYQETELDWDKEGQVLEGHIVAKEFVRSASDLPENLLLPLKVSFPGEFEKYS